MFRIAVNRKQDNGFMRHFAVIELSAYENPKAVEAFLLFKAALGDDFALVMTDDRMTSTVVATSENR